MARHWNYTIIAVLASQQAAANQAAVNMGGSLNALTFEEGYGASSSGPVTHYVACITLDDGNRAQVEGLKAAFPGSIVIDYVPGTDFPPALVAAQGLVPVGG